LVKRSCGRIIPRKTEDGRQRDEKQTTNVEHPTSNNELRTKKDGRQRTRGISNIEYSMSNYKVKGLNKELSEWI